MIDAVFAGLQKANIVTVSTGSINSEYLLPLGHIVAGAAAEEFGFHNDQGIMSLAQAGEQALVAMQRGKVLS